VNWQLDHIFTQDGKLHCSAGVTAGIDLTLNIVEQDHGRQLALDVAREMVVFIRRNGGQSQYSRPLQAQSTSNQRLAKLYSRIEADPTDDWTVQKMASLMGTTERTLHRDFVKELKMSPSRFVEERRVGIARTYLEQSPATLKEIAVLSGFVTEQKMRRSFQKLLGVLPGEYGRRFGAKPVKT
jgi:transcriptional regulator GlxA family with amidase domain